jgi:hypothetical protein
VSNVNGGLQIFQRSNERLGRVDRRHGSRPHASDEFVGQGTWATPHVENTQSLDNGREVCESRSERLRVPTHESVVSASPHGKAHNRKTSYSQDP